jgi:SagB-type dehydrogenase family enzyme
MRKHWLAAVVLVCPALCLAGDVASLALPAPQKDGGKPLMQVLNERKSVREFSPEKLPLQVLSNLLWAASGVNRPDGRRTAPTASNHQEIDVYVAQAAGLYLYDPKGHRLQGVLGDDLRAATGTQDYVGTAALNLVYVADYAKMGNGSAEDKLLMSGADTGFISQNVYLFCASQGLATVVRGSVNRATLATAMHLRPEQHIVLAQTVGLPKK